VTCSVSGPARGSYVPKLARKAYSDLGDAGAAVGGVNGGLPGGVAAQLQADFDVDILHLQVKRTMVPAAGRGGRERDISKCPFLGKGPQVSAGMDLSGSGSPLQ